MSLSALVLGAALATGPGPGADLAGVTEPVPVADRAAASDAEEPEAPAFSGTFRFVGGKRERQGVTDAIERAVQALLPIFHEIARRRLGRANIIPDRVSMTMKGDELEIRYGVDQEPMRAPLDGSIRHWHNREGTRVKFKLERRGKALLQTSWGPGGRRVMKWTLGDDGKRLRVHSTMSSPQLPVDIVYRLTFRQ